MAKCLKKEKERFKELISALVIKRDNLLCETAWSANLLKKIVDDVRLFVYPSLLTDNMKMLTLRIKERDTTLTSVQKTLFDL